MIAKKKTLDFIKIINKSMNFMSDLITIRIKMMKYSYTQQIN